MRLDGRVSAANAICFIAWVLDQAPPAVMRMDAQEPRALRERLQCPSCPATLENTSSLRAHVAGVHGAARFFCDVCDAGFPQRVNLVRHRATNGACAGSCVSVDLRDRVRSAVQ